MPQLDKVTFLSQFFWLVFFYFGFYLILVKHFLPKIARLLKLRHFKINTSQEAFETRTKEQNHLLNTRENISISGAQLARNSVATTLQKTSEWVNQNLDQTNRGHFQKLNTAYITSLQNMMSAQNTIQMIHLKSVLSPRSHRGAGLLPQSGPKKESFFTKKTLSLLTKIK